MTDPQHLVDELVRAGWTLAGQHAGQYVRLLWPGHAELAGRVLFIPLDQNAPDFAELWQAALGELEDAVATGVKAAYALAGVVAPGKPADLT